MLIRNLLLVIVMLYLSGCAASYAPGDWLPEPDKVQQDTYGAWLTIEPVYANPKLTMKYRIIGGEFIGADSSNIYMLNDSLVIMPIDSIRKSILEVAQTNKSLYAGWTILGTLSTISHGIALIISFPAWIVTGATITANESYSNRYEADNPAKDYWQKINKFSRFPQGIPQDLDLQNIKPKPKEALMEDDAW